MRLAPGGLIVALLLAACSDGPAGLSEVDQQLRDALDRAGVTALPSLPPGDPALVGLGQALMFDKILSGNSDVSCATCHNPVGATTDRLSLAIGTGGQGAAASRVLGAAREFVPRNSQDLFNRGYPEFNTMFWDGRVANENGSNFHTPAGAQLPDGLNSALAAQAMFPVATRLEMRGQQGDIDRLGHPNELADLDDADLPAIWSGLMDRLMAIPQYVELFRAAYPSVQPADLGFQHAANAIGAFETEAFTTVNSPLDRYLRGEATALDEAAKRGALLFFGKANCGACHLGPHLSDNLFHSIAVPQVGPGFADAGREDRGRERVSGSAADRFRFRTPPLRNVALTGPWMHDGAYTTLEAAVRHYLDARKALWSYDPGQLRADVRASYQADPATLEAMASSADVLVSPPLSLTDGEVSDIVAFLQALTDPAATQLGGTVPASVPSGLPVGD